MIFRQLLDPRSSTLTYLLGDEASGEAILVDPVFDQVPRDAALVRELGLRLRCTVDTHVHADHVTGAWRLRRSLGSAIAVAAGAGTVAEGGADRLLVEGDRLPFGQNALRVLVTPGHTDGCISLVLERAEGSPAGPRMVFTGDSLMIRAAGRTDFQQGSARRLYQSVHEKLFALPDDTLVYPGHDYAGRTCSSIGEERAHNPRLGGGRSVDDFAGFMDNLGLPHPNQIEVAVPANLRCGRPDEEMAIADSPWEPARRSFAGVLEVEPTWLVEHLAEVVVLDVREPAEWSGELGRIRGARMLPLGRLRAAIPELEKDPGKEGGKPIVAVCRSGGRSAQASLILERAGFSRAANLTGGMIAWRGHGLPVDAA